MAVNSFDRQSDYTEDQLREALDLLPHTPVVFCDARDQRSSADALLTLVRHLLERAS